MLWFGAAWSSTGRADKPRPDEQVQQKVTVPQLRIYLVFLNLFAILFTGLLQIGNVPVLYVFRIMQGVIAGMYMNFVPTYIS